MGQTNSKSPPQNGRTLNRNATPQKTPKLSSSQDASIQKHVYQQQLRQQQAFKKQQELQKQRYEQNTGDLQKSVQSALKIEETPLMALSKSTGFSLILLRRLSVLFQLISGAIVQDNLIDPHELSSALGLSTNSFLFRALFKLFDATSSQHVNFRTWVLTLYILSPNSTIEDKLKFSFSLLDLNGDGCIERDEMINLVTNVIDVQSHDDEHDRALGITKEDIITIVNSALQHADENGDGEISYAEYCNVMRQSKHFYLAFTIDIDLLCAVFTSDEVQQAVILSDSESMARTHHFQSKGYQKAIQESFSQHVFPTLLQHRLSHANNNSAPNSPNHDSNSFPKPRTAAMNATSPIQTVSVTPTATGTPIVETLDMDEWDNHRFTLTATKISVSGPQLPVTPKGTTPLAQGTIAELVRLRSMSGVKNATIAPVDPLGDDWMLLQHEYSSKDDDFAEFNKQPRISLTARPPEAAAAVRATVGVNNTPCLTNHTPTHIHRAISGHQAPQIPKKVLKPSAISGAPMSPNSNEQPIFYTPQLYPNEAIMSKNRPQNDTIYHFDLDNSSANYPTLPAARRASHLQQHTPLLSITEDSKSSPRSSRVTDEMRNTIEFDDGTVQKIDIIPEYDIQGMEDPEDEQDPFSTADQTAPALAKLLLAFRDTYEW